jgi:hypothetical protein
MVAFSTVILLHRMGEFSTLFILDNPYSPVVSLFRAAFLHTRKNNALLLLNPLVAFKKAKLYQIFQLTAI